MPAAFDDLPSKVVWARRGFWARFTPELETAFIAYHEHGLIQRARWSAGIAAMVMAVYAVLDVMMVPSEILPHFLWVRGLMMILPLMGIWSLSYSAWGQRHLQRIAALASVSSGLAVVVMLWIAHLNGTPIAYEGLILTIFYFYSSGGLRLRYAALAGMVAAIAYPLVEYGMALPAHDIVTRAIFLVSTNIVGVVSAGLMELSARRNFAQRVQLEAMGREDPLTGLLNRRALDQRLMPLWERAAREGMVLHVVMIDVDHFKAYNDHYGHAGGDEVLRRVAHVLRRHKRGPDDLVARYGGEEFLCIWADPSDAPRGATPPLPRNRLGAILQDIHDAALPHAAAPRGTLSLSVGALSLRPSPDQPAAAASAIALRQADALLYLAKAEGRNRAVAAAQWTPQAGSTTPTLRETIAPVDKPATACESGQGRAHK